MAEPDVSERRQWLLLKKLLEEPVGTKFGAFLKKNSYPHDARLGKYYGQIRNKNQQIMSLSAEERIGFIDSHLREVEVLKSDVTEIKQLPTVNRLMLIDILASLSLDGKHKMISILKDLPYDEQVFVIKIIKGL